MVSEANPYLWASAAAAFAGLAAGQALRAFAPIREGALKAARRRPRRGARALAFLSLGILCVVGLLVFPAKDGLAMGRGPDVLLAWSGLVFLLAFLAGFQPLVAGLPLALASCALAVALRLSLEGWLPLRPAASGAPLRFAAFLPYEVGPAASRGHLELLERDSVSVSQDLSLGAAAIALTVERLGLAGPPGFLAELASAGSPGPAASPRLYYRVAGVAVPGAPAQPFAAPAHVRLLDLALPLPAGAGLEPAGPPALRSGPLGLCQRSRSTSAAAPLVALQPLSFSLGADGTVSSAKE